MNNKTEFCVPFTQPVKISKSVFSASIFALLFAFSVTIASAAPLSFEDVFVPPSASTGTTRGIVSDGDTIYSYVDRDMLIEYSVDPISGELALVRSYYSGQGDPQEGDIWPRNGAMHLLSDRFLLMQGYAFMAHENCSETQPTCWRQSTITLEKTPTGLVPVASNGEIDINPRGFKSELFAVSSNGRHIAIVNNSSIETWEVTDSGALEAVNFIEGLGFADGENAEGVVISPDGKFVFAYGQRGSISSFLLDEATGFVTAGTAYLRQDSETGSGLVNIIDVAVSVDGTSLYAAGTLTGESGPVGGRVLHQFRILPRGDLEYETSFGTGEARNADVVRLVLASNGKFAYTVGLNIAAGASTGYSIDTWEIDENAGFSYVGSEYPGKDGMTFLLFTLPTISVSESGAFVYVASDDLFRFAAHNDLDLSLASDNTGFTVTNLGPIEARGVEVRTVGENSLSGPATLECNGSASSSCNLGNLQPLSSMVVSTVNVSVESMQVEVASSTVDLNLLNNVFPVDSEDSVTEDPATEDPVTENPMTEDPVIENPVINDPTIEDPTTEDPVTVDSPNEGPVTEDPAIDDSMADSVVSEVSSSGGSANYISVLLLCLFQINRVLRKRSNRLFSNS